MHDDKSAVEVKDDGIHGYDWTYSYLGVLYAKGWIRTRDEWTARFVAEHNGRVARCRGK